MFGSETGDFPFKPRWRKDVDTMRAEAGLPPIEDPRSVSRETYKESRDSDGSLIQEPMGKKSFVEAYRPELPPQKQTGFTDTGIAGGHVLPTYSASPARTRVSAMAWRRTGR